MEEGDVWLARVVNAVKADAVQSIVPGMGNGEASWGSFPFGGTRPIVLLSAGAK